MPDLINRDELLRVYTDLPYIDQSMIDLIVAQPSVSERVLNYDRELNRLGIPPNGDDYNAIFDLVMGNIAEDYLPSPSGR